MLCTNSVVWSIVGDVFNWRGYKNLLSVFLLPFWLVLLFCYLSGSKKREVKTCYPPSFYLKVILLITMLTRKITFYSCISCALWAVSARNFSIFHLSMNLQKSWHTFSSAVNICATENYPLRSSLYFQRMSWLSSLFLMIKEAAAPC